MPSSKPRTPTERATALLFQFLDRKQKRDYDLHRYIIVTGKSGYKWKLSRSGTLLRLLNEDGSHHLWFCVSTYVPHPFKNNPWDYYDLPTSYPPIADRMLGLKLILEDDDSKAMDFPAYYCKFTKGYVDIMTIQRKIKALVAQRQRQPT